MARLFSLMNAGAVDHPVHGHFEPDPESGGFDFPDELSDQLHAVHIRKQRAWETKLERDERLHGEETARRRDPETLYNAVAGIANVTKQLADLRLESAGAGKPDADVARLTEEVESLRAQLAAATEAAGDSGTEDAGGEPAGTPEEKPSRTRTRSK